MSDPFAKKQAEIEYRPVVLDGSTEWHWSLLSLPGKERALATGSGRSRGAASIEARKWARKNGYRIVSVGARHPSFAEAAARRIKAVLRLRESEDIDPKEEIMALDPCGPVKDFVAALEQREFSVEQWQRRAGIMWLRGRPADEILTEEEIEHRFNVLLPRLGVRIEPGALTARVEDDQSVIVMFPWEGPECRSASMTYVVKESEEIDPSEFLNSAFESPVPGYDVVVRQDADAYGVWKDMHFVGNVHYDSQEDMPTDANPAWKRFNWIALSPSPSVAPKAFDSFKSAVIYLIDIDKGVVKESEDIDPKDELDRYTVFDEEGLIAYLKSNVNIPMDYDIFYSSNRFGMKGDEQHFQLEYKKFRYGPAQQKLSVALTRSDIGKVERALKRYCVLQGWRVWSFYGDRTHDSDRRWISFTVVDKARKRIGESSDPDSEVEPRAYFDDLELANPSGEYRERHQWEKDLYALGFERRTQHSLVLVPTLFKLHPLIPDATVEAFTYANGVIVDVIRGNEILFRQLFEPKDVVRVVQRLLSTVNFKSNVFESEGADEVDPKDYVHSAFPEDAVSLHSLVWALASAGCRALAVVREENMDWSVQGYVFDSFSGGMKRIKEACAKLRIQYSRLLMEHIVSGNRNTHLNRKFELIIPWFFVKKDEDHIDRVFPSASRVRV